MKSLYEYSLPCTSAILIGMSFMILFACVAVNWFRGIPPVLDSEMSIINGLTTPVFLLSMTGGGEPNVRKRRRRFALSTFVFCAYLLSLAVVIYSFGFPASRVLFIMPVTTAVLFLPWAMWSYRGSKSHTTPNAG